MGVFIFAFADDLTVTLMFSWWVWPGNLHRQKPFVAVVLDFDGNKFPKVRPGRKAATALRKLEDTFGRGSEPTFTMTLKLADEVQLACRYR